MSWTMPIGLHSLHHLRTALILFVQDQWVRIASRRRKFFWFDRRASAAMLRAPEVARNYHASIAVV